MRTKQRSYLAALLVLAACGKGPEAPPAPPPPVVKAAPVEKQSTPIEMEFSGTVTSELEVDIIPRVGGFIEERYFVEGTDVEKGAPLYLIDPRTYQASLDEAQAQLQVARTSLALAETELKRYEQAGVTNAVSQEQVDVVRARRDEAAADVQAGEAAVTNAQLELEFTRITAPFSGRVQETRIDVGELVTAYQDVLTSVVQVDPVYVEFNLSRADLFEVQKLIEQGVGSEDISKYRVRVRLPDGSDYPHDGPIDYVSARIDPDTDTLTARGILPNPPTGWKYRHLIAGQYVPVTLEIGQADALLIPQTAMVQAQAGTQVFVVDADGKATARSVELGPVHGKLQAVAKGLKEGERVIVEGAQKVRDGMPVHVLDGEAKPDAKPAPDTGAGEAGAKDESGG